MDFKNIKAITIPEGKVSKISNSLGILWQALKNWVKHSTEADKVTIYNNGLGYKNGYRLSSSGAEKTQSGSTVTGFIPAKPGDVIRMSGATWGTTVSDGYSYIIFYSSNGTVLATVNRFMNSGSTGVSNVTTTVNKDASSILTDSNGITTFNIVFNSNINYAYIRINATGDGANMIVTVNQEIS